MGSERRHRATELSSMPDGAGLGTGSLLEARESGGTPETFSGASGSAAILRLRLRDYIYATKHTCHRLGSGSDLVDVSLSLSAAMSELNEAMKKGPDYDSSSRDLESRKLSCLLKSQIRLGDSKLGVSRQTSIIFVRTLYVKVQVKKLRGLQLQLNFV